MRWSIINIRLKILLIVVLGFSTFTVNAAFLSRKPLRIVGCEMMLRHPFGFNNPDGQKWLPSLRDFKRRLQTNSVRSNVAKNVDGFYSGPLRKISADDAKALVERVQAIESDILNRDEDSEFFIEMARGSDIVKAIGEMQTVEPRLSAEYKQLEQQLFPLKTKIKPALGALGVSLIFGLPLLDKVLTDLSLGQSPAIMGTGAVGFLIYALFARLNHDMGGRFDTHYKDLLAFLKQITGPNPPQDEIYMDSISTELPASFRKMVFAAPEDFNADDRAVGLRYWGGGWLRQAIFAFKKSLGYDNEALKELKSSKVYVDNIVYFDKSTNEPVWLYFYRLP